MTRFPMAWKGAIRHVVGMRWWICKDVAASMSHARAAVGLDSSAGHAKATSSQSILLLLAYEVTCFLKQCHQSP